MIDPERLKPPECINKYCCQFCGKESYDTLWKDDKCPECGEEYDPILAQDEETD